MHAPPLQIDVNPATAWRAAVWLLIGVALFALLGWRLMQTVPVLSWVNAASLAGLLVALFAGRHLRTARLTMRWDGQCWYLGQGKNWMDRSVSGKVGLAIDLGSFLLLRFDPDTVPTSVKWIALQQSGLEQHWHALRCALYSMQSREPRAIEPYP